jgi:hypothetical protein
MAAEGTHVSKNFSINRYTFNPGDGNFIAATLQTL